MTDQSGPIPLAAILADPAEAPALTPDAAACLFSTDAQLLWASDAGHALAVRLDVAARQRLAALARTADMGPTLERLRAGGVAFTGHCRTLRLAGGGHAVLVHFPGSVPRAWLRSPPPETGAAPEHSSWSIANFSRDDLRKAPPASGVEILRRLAGGKPTLRFVWHTDRDGVIRSVSAALTRALGNKAGVVGKTWSALADRVPAAQDIDAHVRSGRAWSGVTTSWRIAEGAETVSTELGGAPVRDATGAFSGQRGYGLMRFPEVAVTPLSADALPDLPDLPDLLDLQGLQDLVVSAPAGLSRIVAHIARPLATPGEAKPLRDPFAGLETPPLPLFARQVASPGIASAKPGAMPPDRAQELGKAAVTAPGKLSHGERQTLRDIARALGAKVDEAPGKDDGGAGQSAPNQLSVAPVASIATGEVGPISSPPTARELLPDIGQVARPGIGQVAREAPQPPRFWGLSSADATAVGPVSAGAGLQPEIRVKQAAPVQQVSPAMPKPDKRAMGRADDAPHLAASGPVPAPAADADAVAQAGINAIREMFRSLPVAALISRGDVILHANQAFLDLARYGALADVTQHGLRGLFSGAPAAGGFSGRAVLAGARGVRTPVELICSPVPWQGGVALLTLASRDAAADVEARAAYLEAELSARAAREDELRAILDTATDGVLVLDAQGRILSVSRSAEALFGYEQNQVIGESFTRLLAGESHAVAQDYLEALRNGGVASLLNDGREIVGRVRQGGHCQLFMTLGKVGETAGGRYCAVLRDVTSWKKTEGELIESRLRAEAANAQKSDFLARMSHEVRTPLGAMIGFAELMLEERFGPIANPRYREYVRDIHESGQYVISLVNDLLDLARIEAGKMELSFASVDLNAVLSSCVTLMQPQANKARVVLRSSLSEQLPAVIADERAMRQITLNVLGNALKFTDAGGQVIVSSTRTEAGEVVIRVRDTGIGMSDQDVLEALKPFRRLAQGRKTTGTGLGLPLTAALIDANRGALRISSQPGQGTLVEIVLPASRVLAV